MTLLLFLYFSLLFLYFCTTFSSIGTSTKKSKDINTISTSRAKSRGLELGYSNKVPSSKYQRTITLQRNVNWRFPANYFEFTNSHEQSKQKKIIVKFS